MIKGNDKFSGRILNTTEQKYNMNGKIVIKKVEIPYEKYITLLPSEIVEYVNKKMHEEGFDSSRKIERYEDLDKKVIVYRQKKYIIPKRKKI